MSRPATSNYDKSPTVRLVGGHRAWRGAEAWREMAALASRRSQDRPLVIVDTYPGADLPSMKAAIADALPEYQLIDVEQQAAHPIAHIDRLIARNVTDDRIFGVMSHHSLIEFYDEAALANLAAHLASRTHPVVVIGWGAGLVPADAAVLVLADMARWELQLRQRAGAPNWRCDNHEEDPLRKTKRGYFVEWRVADRHKRAILPEVDFVMDANRPADQMGMITIDTFQAAMDQTASRPFRVVPYFDPGVWGGQWMKEVCDLERSADNYAWCFDCVPEENSLLFDVSGQVIELPANDLVFTRSRELLGERTFARFGAEFPIRFDFLDTMGGGNLSLQVHPLTDYIRDTFGMHYTQDESYYLLDADPDAVVYLGVKTDVDRQRMADLLRSAERGETSFPAEDFVNTFAARKHDHFLIPAGTIHCSGINSMVLEISATPYIFTFKMWDWGRVGLDGVPRPSNVDHALRNIQWDRDTAWVRDQLVDQVQSIDAGQGWREERTGLHELEFIEVRRHWFTGPVDHDTQGTVNVLNLVEGSEAIVESPTGAFEPFTVHYAETFIVPASVGPYRIRPVDASPAEELATVKAYVRGTARTRRDASAVAYPEPKADELVPVGELHASPSW